MAMTGVWRVDAPTTWGHVVVLRAFVGSDFVGNAKLTRDGRNATLHDIEVMDLKFPVFIWFPWLKHRRNYRGLGYGNKLLQAVVSYCRDHEIDTLCGEAVGEDFLLGWYQRNGFTFTEENKFEMTINKQRGI